MECCSLTEKTGDYQKFKKESISLETLHLKIRIALRDTEAALRGDPDNENLKTQLADLNKSLEKLNQQAPWIISGDQVPIYLRETSSGSL
jgi:hypothetical protein